MFKAVQYFNFSNALEALEFYQKNFGARIISKSMADNEMFRESLEHMGMSLDEAENFVMNAEFEILGQHFMASSTWKQKEIDNEGASICFTFDGKDNEAVEKAKDFYGRAVEAGCKVDMELGPTEWTELFASIRDPYGISWMLSAE
ncbi:VOC family protein [Salinicoccus sp. HZC-1]|uniref:VOC family protein n=1 Tax=Salinicoccus sp. HZC-1 TaxID=3385497 RepID=UPI00398AD584